MSDKKVTLTIDGQEITVPEGTLVIRAAEMLGKYVPRFCDHPYLKPLGACRQCMVEVEGQRKPLTSCTTTCTDGMVVKTQLTSGIAKDAQEGVLELLLINHPLDCPMCDKGGECPLQDQTLAYGPGASRFIDNKRRFVKPVPVNDLVYLDRERCVLCARCTRFASEISGDPFIELFERGALEQVAIFEDDPYDSNFSGNVIQICPVGALTSRDFRFRARPFDMTSTDTTCNICSSGCSITIQERRNQIVRVLAADDNTVNDVWSCDKGRFGWAYVGHSTRAIEPAVRKGGEIASCSWTEAVRTAADRIRAAKENGETIALLHGGNLLDEDTFALSLFARDVLQTNDVALVGTNLPLPGSTILDACDATNESIDAAATIVVAGVDLYETSPIVFLRVRKAFERGARVVEIAARGSKLPGEKLLAAPGSLGAAFANAEISAGPVVVLAGEQLEPAELETIIGGAKAAGAAFGFVPRRSGTRPSMEHGVAGSLTRELLERLATGRGLIHIVGSNPVEDFEDGELALRAMSSGATMIAQGMFLTNTSSNASVMLAAASPAEREGTITNWEGRPRAIRRALDPAGLVLPDWEIFARIAREMDVEFPRTLDELRDRMRAAPRPPAGPAFTPRPRGAFGDLALVSYRLLLDQGQMLVGAEDLHGMMKAPFAELCAADADARGLRDGDRVRVTGTRGHAEVTLRVAERVRPGVAFLPADQPGLKVVRIAGDGTIKVERA